MNILNEMTRTKIPGLSVSSFTGDKHTAQHYGALQAGTNRKVQEDTLFHACSISKFITALCVLNLAAEHVLDLHQDVNFCLDAWKLEPKGFATKQPVTLSMLLSHHSGIVDPEDSFGPYRNGEKPVTNPEILKGATRFHAGPVVISQQPEAGFSYSDAGFCVIGQVVRDMTGKSIPQHAQKYVFDRLTVESAFFWQRGEEKTYPLERCAAGHDSGGTVIGETWPCYPNPEGAGLWITAAGLAAIAADFIKCLDGSGRILPQKQAREMQEQGWALFPLEDGRFFMSQGWGEGMQCKLVGDVKNKRGIVVMMNQEPGIDQTRSIIGGIIRAFL